MKLSWSTIALLTKWLQGKRSPTGLCPSEEKLSVLYKKKRRKEVRLDAHLALPWGSWISITQ